MEVAGLRQFTRDFGDGAGPLVYYVSRLSARERVHIEAVRKTRLEMLEGEQVENLTNPTEVITTAFLLRAKDAVGARLFGTAADAERVWEKFSPKAIQAAVVEMNAMDAEPGNG